MSDSNNEQGNKDQMQPPKPEEPKKQQKPFTYRDTLPINVEVNMQPYPSAPPSPPLPVPEDDDPRTSKALDLSEAISRYVPDGIESLAIGGMHMHNCPMALIREIVRQKRHIKRLITSPAASINADLLIGAGLVEEVVTAYIGFEYLGLAPAFRRFAQAGRLKVYEIDELSLVLGLRAGAANQPFVALPPGLEFSDVSRANPEFYKTATDPFTGRTVLAAPAIKPQVALISVQQADKFGNSAFKGAAFTDREMVMAAQTAIVQTEQIVSSDLLTRNPLLVNLPGGYVTGLVEASFGCHPTSSHRIYHYEEAHLKEYLQMAATAEGFERYLETYVYGVSEVDYLSKTAVAAG
jgi:glutaconate CoA-transferase subunit A